MTCPYCKSKKNWKMKTPEWVRLSPGPMYNRRCSDCGQEFIHWLGTFSVRQATARLFIRLWYGFWIAVIVLGLAYSITRLAWH